MAKKILSRPIPEDIPHFTGLPAFLSRIYASRGVKSENELQLNLSRLADLTSLKGLDSAVNLLVTALTSGQKITIIGDFDADGATSSTLAVEALTAMGAKDCGYLVPDRFKFGYGLTPEIVELAGQNSPDILLTVDNGISSFEGVARAHELGMKVIVTDHHLPGDSLPDADAIVNPAQPECEFPSKALAGVGVIFYVMSALRARLRESEWFSKQSIKEPNMADYLDLVALGTVADLVPLDFNNRILVEQGIRRMRAGRARPGISALFEVAGREIKNAVASDLGFAIGPRLNAAGRLDDMATGIECLRSRDLLDARQRAQSLNALNQERKHIEDEMRRDAEAALSEIEQSEEHSTSMSVVLYEPHWHQGVIGILASRIKERLNRPAIAFAPESDDPENIHILKGSARSISGLHMRDALDLVAKRHPKILKKFGGHAMAAGMSLERDMLDAFKAAFNQVVSELLKPEDLEAIAFSDGYLQSEELSLPMVELLERAGPWGQKFPEPRFDAEVRIVQSRVLKERHLKLVVEMPDKQLMDAIEFSSPHCGATLDKAKILFRPAINDYRGRRSVQLLVDQIEPL